MKLLRLRKADALPLALAGAYFLSIHWTMGLRPEHLLLAGFLVGCYFLHEKSRRFVLDFLPIAFFGILYDFLRIYPKAWAGPIHVQWPFELERALFGLPVGHERVIPSFFLQDHHAAFVDVVTGLTYSLHMVIPIGFAFYAWIRNREFARRFNWTFFIVNLLAFATYIALPVAPPWYVQAFGFQPGDWSVAPQAAGLVHFDALIGHPYFEGVYAKSAWVFGAIPSMHAGFPFLVVWYARKILKKGLIPLVFFMLLVWFSAVYLAHHYVIDLIAGVFYVFVAILIHRLLCPNKRKAPSHASSA